MAEGGAINAIGDDGGTLLPSSRRPQPHQQPQPHHHRRRQPQQQPQRAAVPPSTTCTTVTVVDVASVAAAASRGDVTGVRACLLKDVHAGGVPAGGGGRLGWAGGVGVGVGSGAGAGTLLHVGDGCDPADMLLLPSSPACRSLHDVLFASPPEEDDGDSPLNGVGSATATAAAATVAAAAPDADDEDHDDVAASSTTSPMAKAVHGPGRGRKRRRTTDGDVSPRRLAAASESTPVVVGQGTGSPRQRPTLTHPSQPTVQLINAPQTARISPDAILRALLLVPPRYSTPWVAALSTVATLQSSSRHRSDSGSGSGGTTVAGNAAELSSTMALSLVTEVGLFLGGVGLDGNAGGGGGGCVEGGGAGIGGGGSTTPTEEAKDEEEEDDVATTTTTTTTQRTMLRCLALTIIAPLLATPPPPTAATTADAAETSASARTHADNDSCCAAAWSSASARRRDSASGSPGDGTAVKDNRHLVRPLELLPALLAASMRLEGHRRPAADSKSGDSAGEATAAARICDGGKKRGDENGTARDDGKEEGIGRVVDLVLTKLFPPLPACAANAETAFGASVDAAQARSSADDESNEDDGGCDAEAAISEVATVIEPTMVLPLLTLSSSLSPIMSQRHWASLRRTVLDALPINRRRNESTCSSGCEEEEAKNAAVVPQEDLPGLVRGALARLQATATASPNWQGPRRVGMFGGDGAMTAVPAVPASSRVGSLQPSAPSWEELILRLYQAAGGEDFQSPPSSSSFRPAAAGRGGRRRRGGRSSSSSVLPTVESVLSSTLASMHPSALNGLLRTIVGGIKDAPPTGVGEEEEKIHFILNSKKSTECNLSIIPIDIPTWARTNVALLIWSSQHGSSSLSSSSSSSASSSGVGSVRRLVTEALACPELPTTPPTRTIRMSGSKPGGGGRGRPLRWRYCRDTGGTITINSSRGGSDRPLPQFVDVAGEALDALVDLGVDRREKDQQHHASGGADGSNSKYAGKGLIISGLRDYLLLGADSSDVRRSRYSSILTCYGDIVRRSLFLIGDNDDDMDGRSRRNGGPRAPSLDPSVSHRAGRWVQAAASLLEDPPRRGDGGVGATVSDHERMTRRVCLALAVIGTVFDSVPSSRPSLVRMIVSELSTGDVRRRSLFCLVVSSLVRTAFGNPCEAEQQHGDNDDEGATPPQSALEPIADLLSSGSNGLGATADGGPMPRRTLRELAFALSPLQGARGAILSMARKHLSSPFKGGGFWVSAAGGGEGGAVTEGTAVALDGLCTLMRRRTRAATGERPGVTALLLPPIVDRCGMEALVVLSDLVALNRPHLPVQARAKLYCRITKMANEGALDDWTCGRLRDASLTLLLTFFGLISVRGDSDETATEANQQGLVFLTERCFVSWGLAKESDGGAEAKARKRISLREDLPALLRLILSLMNCPNSPSGDTGVRSTVAEANGKRLPAATSSGVALASPIDATITSCASVGFKRELAAHLIQVLCGDVDESPLSRGEVIRREAKMLGQSIVGQDEADQFSRSLFKLCLSAMVRHLLCQAKSYTGGATTANNEYILEDCSMIQTIIASNERRAFSESLTGLKRDDITKGATLPRWTGIASINSREALADEVFAANDMRRTDLITSPFCNFAVKVLLDSKVYEQNGVAHLRSQLDLSHAVNKLLEISRKSRDRRHNESFKENGAVADATRSEVMPKEGITVNSAADFFSLSSEMFPTLIANDEQLKVALRATNVDEGLLRVDSLVHAVIDYCIVVQGWSRVIRSKLAGKTKDCNHRSGLKVAFESHRIFRSLWRLYQTMAGETASCSFIRYLDVNCVQSSTNDITMDRGDGRRSLSYFKIASHHDVDQCIRKVRFTILSTLHSLLEHQVDSPTASVDGCFDDAQVLSDLCFGANMIYTLCVDISDGLLGKSGGMTRDMYQLFLRTVDACAGALLSVNDEGSIEALLNSPNGATPMDLSGKCHSASINLWNIVCKFPLKEATPFKMTLMLSLSRLPSLRRRIERLAVKAPSGLDQTKNLSHQKDILAFAFQKCVDGMKSEHVAAESGKKEPTIASENFSDGVDDNESFIEASRPRSLARSMPKCLECLQMPSNASLSWAHATAFLAAERNWMESYQIVKSKVVLEGRGDLSRHSIHKSNRQAMHWYAARRKRELSCILSCMTSILDELSQDDAFKRSDKDISDKKQQDAPLAPAPTVVAELLSPSGKLCFCSCLDRIAVTLKTSVHFVLHWMKRNGSALANADDATFVVKEIHEDAMLIEALASVTAWLCSPDPVSFTSGARRWYRMEKLHYRGAKLKSENAGRHLEEDPVLGRLPRLLFRIEQLETGFQNLAGFVTALSKGSNKKGGTCSMKCVQMLDAFLIDILDASSDDSGNFLSRIIVQHRAKLSRSQGNSDNMALISLQDGDEDFYSVDTGTVGKRKRPRKNTTLDIHLRKARRNILRSRNEVVDEWLSLDANNADGGGASDAYVDLEDFLVEG